MSNQSFFEKIDAIEKEKIELTCSFIMESEMAEHVEAHNMALFTHFCANENAVSNLNNWARGDRARVYFKFESQNSLYPVQFLEKVYYCAFRNNIYTVMNVLGQVSIRPLSALSYRPYGFSGAKTREAIKGFSSRFYKAFINE